MCSSLQGHVSTVLSKTFITQNKHQRMLGALARASMSSTGDPGSNPPHSIHLFFSPNLALLCDLV